jgi:hypothetical protein
MRQAWKLDSRNEVHVSQQPEVHHATKGGHMLEEGLD